MSEREYNSHSPSSPAGATDAISTAVKINPKEVDIRIYSREDLAKLPALLESCLGRRSSQSWVEWKTFNSPYQIQMMFMVAYHGDDLVGFIGANPVPFSLDGELTVVYQHQDTAIREDARNLRLLMNMIDKLEDRFEAHPDIKLTYSITAPHLRSLVTKRMKYTVVWENLKMVKIISLRGFVSKATRSKALASLIPGPKGKSWKAPGSMTGEIRQIDSFGPEFDEFWKNANVPGDKIGRVFPWQDSKWLNYKFCQDEMVDFLKYAYVENNEVLGYVVLNITKLDVRVGYLESLWTVPSRDDIIELLTDFALHEFQSRMCDQVSCWTRPTAPVGNALAKHGFVRRPTPQCISVKQGREGMGDLALKEEHWNLQRGHTYYTSLGHLAASDGTAERPAIAKAMRDKARRDALRAKGHTGE